MSVSPTSSTVATTELPELEVPKAHRPQHIAVIMDGNGRWARQRNLPRTDGHRAGARAVRDTVIECGRLGIPFLTLYSFSLENWKRPEAEVQALMALCLEYLSKQRQELIDNNVRFRQIGRREGLPQPVLDQLDETIEESRHCTGLTLSLALNYGARAELVDATRRIAERIRAGEMDPDAIDEKIIAQHLYTADIPDPDLLLRTAGEFRVSNYLLWQISYAEIHVTNTLWPDFGVPDLHRAIRDFTSRERRYGALSEEA
ncbi:MAG: isoprenyl transferase [Phycisphaerales bacterium]|nr:MAG: isoprenyl transferase [Phycisphaerales bacterium]